jgi:hypothetical protein
LAGQRLAKEGIVPLSDHEKRLLDQIAQTLGSEDPGLASSLRSARPRASTPALLLFTILGFIVGFVVLLVGLRLRDNLGTGLGVLGYLMIVGASDAAVRLLGRARSGREPNSKSRWRRRPA